MNYSQDRQLAPQLSRLLGVLCNTRTLAVELVVLGAGELLGALGAVVAAAGAERGAGESHARRGAGGSTLGEHGVGGVGRVERRAIGSGGGGGG